MHKQNPHGKCPVDDGQWPDRWTMARPTKNGQQKDHLKNDASVKKDMFPAEHIFFEVPHHVPICVHFYMLNQPAARCM